MINCPARANNALPAEYRKIAENLFPPEGYTPGKGPSVDAAIAFSEILGIGADYRKLLAPESPGGGNLNSFWGHFQNNLDLLIQKTWVEKADEIRKEKLVNRIPGFIADIGQENYPKALGEFGVILEELAYLFFGAQSQKDDFTEYALRIDTQMGLFWWYGGQLERFLSPAPSGVDKNSLLAVLLIGICYLTNF
ncbi:MAG: hypothetical protein LBI91_05195 [Spirochaetaceae bacterium]|jgi:hypothetical protein|nr:hypothetical protein [Spirochaetaceae bacterium]